MTRIDDSPRPGQELLIGDDAGTRTVSGVIRCVEAGVETWLECRLDGDDRWIAIEDVDGEHVTTLWRRVALPAERTPEQYVKGHANAVFETSAARRTSRARERSATC